jgi:1-acyl-sn-glycerol-3-phosphate acyltransferase
VYALLSRLFGLALDLFYDRRHLDGVVPVDGPTLIVANHPNALVDPIVVTRVARRRVQFLAKEPLFRTPVLKYFVKSMGALPVFRKMDGADTSKNADTFSAVYDALEDGAAICLFPEGISHHLPAVQPLKTGAARMALGAQERIGAERSVQIVPVGLIYRDKTKFRSDLVTQIGEPLRALDFVHEDERESARALTDAIGERIETLTINMERWEDQPLLELAERIYETEGDTRPERVRRIAQRALQLRELDPGRLDELRARVERFWALLTRVGLRPEALDARADPGTVAAFVMRNLVALFVGLPVAIVGALAYVAPFTLVSLIARWRAPKIDVDEIAGVKIVTGLLLYPAWQLALFAALVAATPWAVAIPLGLVLPFAGLYAHHFVRRRHRALLDIRAFFAIALSRRLRRKLAIERDAIRAEMEAIAQTLPEDPMAPVEDDA